MIRKIIVFIVIASSIFAQTAVVPSAGDGSKANPYQIETLENLYWIAADTLNWNKHYIQTADIDAAETQNGIGWRPIGNKTKAFSGSYDGQFHTITLLHAYIGYDIKNKGFFGVTDSAEVKRMLLEKCSIQQDNAENKGMLIGYSKNSHILKCCSIVNIAITQYTGGLIGYMENSIVSECYTKGQVSPSSYYDGGLGGGVVGKMSNSQINNCYSHIIFEYYDYFIGVGPIICGLDDSSLVEKCYSTYTAHAHGYFAGIPGSDSFCLNTAYSSPTSSYSFIKSLRTIEQMKNPETYLNADWDFVNESENGTDDIWDIDTTGIINEGYPYLSWEDGVSSNFTSVKETAIPLSCKLNQNYPNPFNPITTIGYEIREDSHAKLDVYSITGQLVETLADGYHQAGAYSVKWNAGNLSSGIYIYRLEYGEKHISRKMLLIK